MNDNIEQLQRSLDHVLADTLHRHDGSIVNRWIVLADVMDPEGERALVSLAQADMKPWDSLGMLEFARQVEQAATTNGDP